MASLDSAISQMVDRGMPPPGDVRYGKIVRYGRPKKKYWYILREFRTRKGDYFVHGAFGWFEGAEKFAYKIESDFTAIDADERERMQRAMKAEAERQAEHVRERAHNAANRARAQWHAAVRPHGDAPHPYLVRKGVTAESVRVSADGQLLIPMMNYAGEKFDASGTNLVPDYSKAVMNGLQKIDADGGKLFNKGMDMAGTMCRLGKVNPNERVLLLTEGYVTGRSIRMATNHTTPVFVAFTAGNLPKAARVLRALFPDAHLVLCADDDGYCEAQINRRLARDYGVEFSEAQPPYRAGAGRRTFSTPKGVVEVEAAWLQDGDGVDGLAGVWVFDGRSQPFAIVNAGCVKAYQAVREAGNASVVRPLFKDRALTVEPDTAKLTDFNDLHAAEGLDAVTAQIDAAILAGLAPRRVRDAATQPSDGAAGNVVDIATGKPKKPRKAAPAAGAGGGVKDGAPPRDPEAPSPFLPFRLHRFTYIYPTDTVFDHTQSRLVHIGNLKHAFGGGPVKWWLEWHERRQVNVDDVVFDPLGKSNPATTVNLFKGIEAKPDPAASCRLLLELIHYLCGEDIEATHTPLTDWVLNWMAYPLQHVGAKMRTAVVMFGEEGTGKNQFWGAVREIYGRYGGLITQNQLNSHFNTWLSAKLFLIANEVVTAQERSYYVGYLKNLITEPEILIEPKGVDARRESNHCNFVFLSNELQPLKIGPNDRRYMILRTPRERDKAFYLSVGKELDGGGAMALYEYLLRRDIGDFNEHTKPIHTAARFDLIELSLTSTQLYWQELHDGLLPMPYGPAALVADVFEGYRIWCERNGEKMPAKISQFSSQFMSMNGVRRTPPLRVADPDIAGERALTRSELPQRKLYCMGGDVPPEADRDAWFDQSIGQWRAALKTYRSRGRISGRQEGGDDGPF